MTTSVYKPIDFTSLSRSGVVDRRLLCRPGVQKVKRALFEVDHDATERFIKEEFDKIRTNESERWNFDFRRERTLNPNGSFQWQVVDGRTAAAAAPRRPLKRPAEPSDLLDDLYVAPGEIIRPKAIKPSNACEEEQDRTKPVNINNNNNNNHNHNQHTSHQTTIPDFMKQKKRPLPADKKTASDRPTKIAKRANIVS